MAAATENADELVRTLTRVMNRARQDAITTEIMEIVGGAEALRQVEGSLTPMTTTDHARPPCRPARSRTAGSSPSPDRSSTSSSRPTPCPRSTTRRDRPRARRRPRTPSRPRWPSRSARAASAASACSRPTASCAAPPCATWAGASRCRWATPCSATCSTCSASRSTPTRIGEVDDYWEIHRNAPAFDQLEPGPRCSRPASRSSTCSSPTCRAARSASSAGPAWARPSSSRR